MRATLGVFNHYLIHLSGNRILEGIVATHTGLHFVYILTACSGRSEGIPTQVGRVNLNFNRVVDEWNYKYGGKGCHTFALCVERRHSHKAMYSVFGLQIAVSKIALYLYCYRFDAGFITFKHVCNLGFIALFLAPAQVHTHKHLCPILRFGTSGAGYYLQHCPEFVFLLAKHIPHLKVFYHCYCSIVSFVYFFFCHSPLFIKIKGYLCFIYCRIYIIISFYPKFYPLYKLHLLLGSLLVLPKFRGLSL